MVKEWQSRPLESVYAVVFMDAIHFHVRSEGQIIKKAVYIAIGINMEGTREVLGMWIGENESAKFWLSVLNGLKNRGLEDIRIACVDAVSYTHLDVYKRQQKNSKFLSFSTIYKISIFSKI